MKLECVIREERAADRAAIKDVTIEAFRTQPYSSHTEQFIIDAIRSSGALTLSLVAETQGQIIGHIAFSPVKISDGTEGWYGLGPLSVRPIYQGLGIGSRLVAHGLTSMRQHKAKGCVVFGSTDYYGRFGFSVCEGLIYPDAPPALFHFISFSDSHPLGTVTYNEGFNAKG
jgi:putative acetyltransferase